MNNLKDIHNKSGLSLSVFLLFYQDFNEQFEGYTQHGLMQIGENAVVLSGFQ